MRINMSDLPGVAYRHDADDDIHYLTYAASSQQAVASMVALLLALLRDLRAEPGAEARVVRIVIDVGDHDPPVRRLIMGLEPHIPEVRQHPFAAIRMVSVMHQTVLAQFVGQFTFLLGVPRLQHVFYQPDERDKALAWLRAEA